MTVIISGLTGTKPTTSELHWAAGFIEGEGSFFLAGGGGGGRKGLLVSAAQVNTEPLSKLCSMFGGGLYYKNNQKLRNRGSKAKDLFYWQVGGPRAVGVALTLFVLLSKKRRDQIIKALRKNSPARQT